MVFCYQNCSDLLFEQIVLMISKKVSRSLEHIFFLIVGQNNSGNKIPLCEYVNQFPKCFKIRSQNSLVLFLMEIDWKLPR